MRWCWVATLVWTLCDAFSLLPGPLSAAPPPAVAPAAAAARDFLSPPGPPRARLFPRRDCHLPRPSATRLAAVGADSAGRTPPAEEPETWQSGPLKWWLLTTQNLERNTTLSPSYVVATLSSLASSLHRSLT
eukprot:EG_transcript_40108